MGVTADACVCCRSAVHCLQRGDASVLQDVVFQKELWPKCSFSSWAQLPAALLQMLGKPRTLLQQFPEWGLMMQRGRKAPAPSLVVVMMRLQRALAFLKPCWWVQSQHAAILGGIRIYLIYIAFFLWGGVRGVRCSVSSVTSIRPHCYGSRNARGKCQVNAQRQQ